MIGPVDAAALKILAHWLNWAKELALLDGERAHRELDRRTVAKQKQCFEHRKGILAARKRHGNPVAVANHLETRHGLADLAQECLFEIQVSIIAPTTPKPLTSRVNASRWSFGSHGIAGSSGDPRVREL